MVIKTHDEAIAEVTKGLQLIGELYKNKCINWSGKTSDTNEWYTELISQRLLQLCKMRDVFSDIPIITRASSYFKGSHSIVEFDTIKSNRGEEIFAKRITGLNLEGLGLVLDYQIPLKSKKGDKGLGKIDLVSYNQINNTMYLIEFKYDGNQETLLRATLECYTYYHRINLEKLKLDFFNEHPKLQKIGQTQVDGVTVKQAVLLTKGCNAYTELVDMQNGNRPFLKEFTDQFGTNFFSIDLKINSY